MLAMSRPRVLLLADRSRPQVADVLRELLPALEKRADVVGEIEANSEPLTDVHGASLGIAIGGDGTLISQARRLIDAGLPLVGVNIGRLGFLAEFNPKTLMEHADVVFGPSPPVHEHMMLSIEVLDDRGGRRHECLAMNDGVITAGEPFRMVELAFAINGVPGPTLNGDGVVVATPIGSTAYNVSAGGPIVHPALEAITITPLAAHSLAFRPIVLDAASEVRATVMRANPGTAIVADGRIIARLAVNQSVCFKRHHRKARFVVNPSTTYWRILLDKLRWAAPPEYRER